MFPRQATDQLIFSQHNKDGSWTSPVEEAAMEHRWGAMLEYLEGKVLPGIAAVVG